MKVNKVLYESSYVEDDLEAPCIGIEKMFDSEGKVEDVMLHLKHAGMEIAISAIYWDGIAEVVNFLFDDDAVREFLEGTHD